MAVIFPNYAKSVLKKRYLKKDQQGNVLESQEEMLQRVAAHVASGDRGGEDSREIQKTRDKFFKMMANLWFLPNSPTLMNAGNRLGQLAACFVLPVEDSMESIFDAVKHTAIIHKSGGGTGFSFSHIRPADDIVSSTRGVSSGPLSFMNVFDVATEAVKQGGTRRGANMGVLRVDHPDIQSFITAKNDGGKLTNFNLSVAVTQQFLEALDNGSDYDLINPRDGKAVKRASAAKIFDLICASAWKGGEPGIIFIDRINQSNPTPQLGWLDATNPCGEQPLLPYESCTLGSINLSRMATSRGVMTTRLKRTVHAAVHFLDNVIEVNQYPLPQIAAASRQTRKIGLGVMGFADMLIRLNIPYDSQEAVDQAESVMALIHKEARSASMALGKRRGNFPAYGKSVFNRPKTPHMRNATVTTIAPTGTISLLAGTSSGIEPLYSVSQARQGLANRSLADIHPLFLKFVKREGLYSAELIKTVRERGSIQTIEALPRSLRRMFRTAHDISPHWHVNLQAAFQKHTDNAVSKTVNFPASGTQGDIAETFLAAARQGCKGITVYRDGSRQNQVLQTGSIDSRADGERIAPRPRPQRTQGVTDRINTGCGKLYVTINSDAHGTCEVFAQMGKTGGCASSQIEASGRLISLALRSGVKVEAIVKQMSGIRCPSPSWQNGKMVLSCPDAMAQVIQRVAMTEEVNDASRANGMCPDCGGALVHEEGCLNCRLCGFSKCS
jgi:ribonucleoside-diphosphate reductase alpha chain